VRCLPWGGGWKGTTYKEMRYFGFVLDGFGLGGVDADVEVGGFVDEVETATDVEDFTEVVNGLEEEVLLELATPGMHWPGGVSPVSLQYSRIH